MKRMIIVTSAVIFTLFVVVFATIFSNRYPFKYKKSISVFAAENKVDAALVAAIVFAESRFNNNAKSKRGAIGLMQIMPQTAEWISGELSEPNYDLTDAQTNLHFGCFYLSYLQSKFNSEIEVLCAYNAGETKVNEWKNTFGEITEQNIPFSETKNYVKIVLKAKKYYSKKLG